MCARKSMGLRTEPCRTPEDTAILSDLTPFKTTAWERESSKSLTQLNVNSIKCNFEISFSCATLSNALLKSKRIKSVCFPVCMFLAISSTSITNWVSQDLFSLNPCCSSSSMLELAKCLAKLDATMCLSTLYKTPEWYRAILCRVWLVSFFENGRHICFFPAMRKLPGVKWLLEDHLQYRGKFCMERLWAWIGVGRLLCGGSGI